MGLYFDVFSTLQNLCGKMFLAYKINVLYEQITGGNVAMKRVFKRALSAILLVIFMFTAVCVAGEPITAYAQHSTTNVASVANTLRSYSIPLQNGSSLPVSSIREDYIAFIFGRATCFNCNGMTSDMDTLQEAGYSIHKVFIPIDGTDTSSFAQDHPGKMTIARYINDNNYLAYNLCNQVGITYGTLPALFILDKNRNLIWASTGYDDSGLMAVFGVKGATSVQIKYSTKSTNIETGDSFKVSVVPNPSNALVISKKVTSSDSSVISVAADGTCKAKGVGYAYITVQIKYMRAYTYSGVTEVSPCTSSSMQVFSVSKKKEPAKPATTKPAATKITSLKNAKKAFTVKWKKVSKVKGYQVQYSTSSKMKKPVTKTYNSVNTTKATFKKLKSKKYYYVRDRTYKKVNGKKVYSKWTAIKKIKTK